MTDDGTLSIVVFGAHPDDCDFRFGGMAMLYRALGHTVRFVSMTNGDTGHYCEGGGPLARRRYAEAQASAAIADVQYDIIDIHNGELDTSVTNRKIVIQIMRQAKADLVLCHRANDYHPDHRAVGTLVQDAAYTVTVPNVCPLTDPLLRAPIVGYSADGFTDPTPFRADIAIDVESVMERKVDMCMCHVSQVFEWLRYGEGKLNPPPEDPVARRADLARGVYARCEGMANQGREALLKCYGEERGTKVRYAETIMISQYGRGLPEDQYKTYFPFFP
jgi:N-acetylglucosamine malate deacetylase 1